MDWRMVVVFPLPNTALIEIFLPVCIAWMILDCCILIDFIFDRNKITLYKNLITHKMKAGTIIIIVSFLIGVILIAIALGLFFGVKTEPEYVGGGETGTKRPDRYTYCLYNGTDVGKSLGLLIDVTYKPFTYMIRDNNNSSGASGSAPACPANTEKYTLYDSIRVYKNSKTNDMVKICVYDTLQKDIPGNYVIGPSIQQPGQTDTCPQIGRNSQSFPGEQAMRNISSFYTRGVFGNETLPTTIDLSGGTYNKFCVWKSRDKGIKYFESQETETLRSKNKWIRANSPTEACVPPTDGGYTKVGEFLFEDPNTPSPYP